MVQYVSWNKCPTLGQRGVGKPLKLCGLETIETVWIENSLDLWDIKVLKKIDKCGHELSRWSKRNFGNVRQDLEKKKKIIATGKETFNMD